MIARRCAGKAHAFCPRPLPDQRPAHPLVSRCECGSFTLSLAIYSSIGFADPVPFVLELEARS